MADNEKAPITIAIARPRCGTGVASTTIAIAIDVAGPANIPANKRVKNKLSIFHAKVQAQVDSVTPSNESNATFFYQIDQYIWHIIKMIMRRQVHILPKYPI